MPANEYFFVAGGIGVTPLVRMIEQVESAGKPWKLAYLGRSRESMTYLDELLRQFPDHVQVFVKAEGQRFDVPNAIATLSSDVHIYSCGPERLLVALEEAVSDDNPSRIHVERFHPREVTLAEPPQSFTVYCQKSDIEIDVDVDETILMAADFAGVNIQGDCMEGTCGACETRVIEGEVDHRDSVLSPQARSDGDTMMICISRARGTRLVLDL
jgi:ferredoxin-NADP reductase